MKKTISCFLLLASFNAFAVTDQINELNSYISNPSNYTLLNADDSSYVNFSGKDVKKGDNSDFVRLIQKVNGLQETGVYDDQVEKIVMSAQKAGNLTPSGVIDSNTWYKIFGINSSNATILAQKSLTSYNSIVDKESTKSNNKFIVVNIPSQKLFLYDKDESGFKQVFSTKVIVGRKSTQTPIEDFEVISIKYSPTWTPTSNMLKKNVYKAGKINTAWLKSHHLKVLDEDGVEHEYDDVQNVKNPRFVQDLGEYNALGNLKFETSSKQDIYLHDTNERHLFSKNIRTYSSGCIRVQNYKELASFISGKSLEHIDRQINKRETFHESIGKKVPVYVDYSQITYDQGKLLVYPDVYGINRVK